MKWRVLVAVLASCRDAGTHEAAPCARSEDCAAGRVCDSVQRTCVVAATPTATGAATSDGRWAAPIPLTMANSEHHDTDPALSPDGLELIFSSRRGDGGGYDLYRSMRSRTADAFGEAKQIAELATKEDEDAPALSSDGRTLYFRRGHDIYRASRAGRGAPFTSVSVDGLFSTTAPDTDSAISGDGLVASITRTLGDGDQELYQLRRASLTEPWSEQLQLVELSTPGSESGAAFDTHALTIFFHSDRGHGHQLWDLYVATRPSVDAPFGAPTIIDELTTTLPESDPTLTADLRILVFERSRDLFITTR